MDQQGEGCAPTGIRTPVLALKGPRPGPLDDGGASGRIVPEKKRKKEKRERREADAWLKGCEMWDVRCGKYCETTGRGSLAARLDS